MLFDLMVIFQRWDILAFEMPSLLFLAEGCFLGVPPARDCCLLLSKEALIEVQLTSMQ